jgi:hypothetical protein
VVAALMSGVIASLIVVVVVAADNVDGASDVVDNIAIY